MAVQPMAQEGIRDDDSLVELIDTAIIEMEAHGGRHIRCVTLLNRLLVAAEGTHFFVSPQNSMRLRRKFCPRRVS